MRLDRFFEAHSQLYSRGHEALLTRRNVAHDCIRPPDPRKRFTKATTYLLHCVCAYCTFTKKTLHLIGKTEIHYCDVRGNVKDACHILLTCPQEARERKISYVTPFVVLADRPNTFMILFF